MSHAYGQVYLKDKNDEYNRLFGYFEYNGTCDVACSAIQHSIGHLPPNKFRGLPELPEDWAGDKRESTFEEVYEM